MSRIDINIDRVILRGVDPADRHALIDGLKSELARIISDPATGMAGARSRKTPVLRAGKLTLEPGLAGARKFGGGVGRAIGKGVTP